MHLTVDCCDAVSDGSGAGDYENALRRARDQVGSYFCLNISSLIGIYAPLSSLTIQSPARTSRSPSGVVTTARPSRSPTTLIADWILSKTSVSPGHRTASTKAVRVRNFCINFPARNCSVGIILRDGHT